MTVPGFGLYLVLAIIAGGYILILYVNFRLSNKDYSEAYDDARKIWTARGIYGEGVEENSIESIRHAFDEGAMGVEVDVYYDVEMNDYIVSHDRPYLLVKGRLLTLKELFDALGEGHYFWLDFKKLRFLTHQQALQAVQRLKAISENNGVQERIYVEGETPINLALFRKAALHTIFDTHPTTDNNLLTPFAIAVYKIFFYFGKHTVMGMEYGSLDKPVYGNKTRNRLGKLPVFLYHVPVDESLLDELVDIQAVRALIVGNNQSVNFHYKKSTLN